MAYNDWYKQEDLDKRINELEGLSQNFFNHFQFYRDDEPNFCTCVTCQSLLLCEFAYDLYNTRGDCIALK